MALPANSQYALTDTMTITRLLNGMWQVSGAHGSIDSKAALKDMLAYYDAGFRTWDLADHYGPAEDFIGAFRDLLAKARGDDAPDQIQAFTKWVPRPGSMPRDKVEAAIDKSRERMNMTTLDMLQFHWWDYNNTAYIDAMKHMTDLQQAGKIRYLALTNFDTQHMATLVDESIPIVSNQVQYSIIDQRPQVEMQAYCADHEIDLLAYGTLCGGLLTDKFLDTPEPQTRNLETASLRKYKGMIDAWGSWSLFQTLLQTLREIADKHSVSIANIAVRYVIEQPQVAGAIVGARLGINAHHDDNARVFDFELDDDDYARIAEITDDASNLFDIIGDCGDEYR